MPNVYVHNMMMNDDGEVSGGVVMSRGHHVGTVNELKCGLVAKVAE